VVPDGAIDAVVVPGLAFDRLGNRLGHGAGYYDRLLARVRPGIPLVGVTGGYVVAELPTEDHDVAMTHLCGPFGVLGVPLPDPEG
jgi:5-formyltetrahydrofolate cyclo-ligase